jgi:predicted RNA-binding Zn ribbon-like protein
MKSRLKAARRVSRLHEEQHRLEKAALLAVDKKIAELRRAEQSILSTMDPGNPLGGILEAACVRRLQKIAMDIGRAIGERQPLSEALVILAIRKRVSERWLARVAEESARSDDLRDLNDVIDTAVANGRVSPP